MAMINIEARELIDELEEKNRKLVDEAKDYAEKFKDAEDMAKQYEAIADETKKELEEVKGTLAFTEQQLNTSKAQYYRIIESNEAEIRQWRAKYKELARKAITGEVEKPATKGRKFIVATKYRTGENTKTIIFTDAIQAIEEATDENGQNYAYIYMSQIGIAVEETIAEIMQKIKKAGAI